MCLLQNTHVKLLGQLIYVKMIKTIWSVLHVAGVASLRKQHIHSSLWGISLQREPVRSLNSKRFNCYIERLACTLQGIRSIENGLDYSYWMKPAWRQGHQCVWRKPPNRGAFQPRRWRPKLAVVSIIPIRATFPNAPRILFLGSEWDKGVTITTQFTLQCIMENMDLLTYLL